jgi:hypothetical protein
MKNSGFIVLAIAIAAGAAISAINLVKPTYRAANTPAASAVSCVDFDPPSQTDKITVNGVTYLLLKRDANLNEEKVQTDLAKIGQADGKDVSVAARGDPNWFGDSLDGIAYIDTGVKNKNKDHLFNVYIKEGMAIPDHIRNCKKEGGQNKMVDYWKTSQFPPAAFNTSDMQGVTGLSNPAYIYDNITMTFAQLKALPGLAQSGTLYVESKKATYDIYRHLGSAYLVDSNDVYEYLPTDRPVSLPEAAQDNLQLKWFYLVDQPVYSWWTLICKPAIYVYPPTSQNVSVQVKTPGTLTLTIPSYPVGGWDVTADPDGTIHAGGKTYPYLYYESKVDDSLIKKPEEGYVRAYSELGTLYDYVLPKLGLNQKEAKEFKEYWTKSLPYAPYYFVGVMPESEVNALEPLQISPAPDSLVRVRFYFQALTSRKDVQEPQLITPKRTGFVVSEWGGAIKSNPNSHFTCIQ